MLPTVNTIPAALHEPLMENTYTTVQARYCEGGHKCIPPKECCTQGCCYQLSPIVQRPTPPTTDHVLNLFFINHWYFWCFVLAIVLALLCLCSLWKKRRQLCGWGNSRPNYQSEGDSTGSCYAPPQYSRCNSFHHAPPPPYMEVTSKPDLYPLVFSYTGGDKGGTNYLMVQYFRNYIVRPVGSLSAASTVDSLSSSFIRSVNEANTLVPPPYSRATSPDLSFSLHNYAMQRSTSQQACSMILNDNGQVGNSTVIYRPCSVPDSQLQSAVRLTSTVPGQISESDSMDFNNCPISIYSNNSNSVHNTLSQNDVDGNGDEMDEGIVNNLAGDTLDIVVNSGHSTSICNNNQRDDSLNNGSMANIDCIEEDEILDENGSEDYELLLQHNLNHYRNIMKVQHIQKDQQLLSFESKESQINDYPKVHRNYSNTDSSVSSLANLGSPASPPRPTSPTFEVREILEQIRQIQSEADNAFFDTLTEGEMALSFAAPGNKLPINNTSSSTFTLSNIRLQNSTITPNTSNCSTKRKMYHVQNQNSTTKTKRDLYLPISKNSHQSCIVDTYSSSSRSSNNHYQPQNNFNQNTSKKLLRNSMTSNCILSRGRLGTRGWISKSAPTTPAGACTLPIPFGGINDSSPLLDEQDEEEEHDDDGEQNF
ncbi:uncharacterized protein LOC134835340 [Culicoides brevitarsis]|uniref:uncharacterized protein LOC134835340 n=1 Tax=Culicoides brevitarsis TaxID=469753 RepID=UPI00307C3A80